MSDLNLMGPLVVLLALPACILSTTTRLTAAEANLVANGDFEQPSPSSPPAGWVMWGDQKYKNPANYTRDTQNPHSGAACFRIHHPAGTQGYVVSSPASAVRPNPGMMYSVSFWARADRPGDALFAWTAYQKIQPFVDAPSPGSFPIQVDRPWKQFRFVLHEGWDFFADQCRYLLLTFKAAGKAETERTLWIDDVVVTQQPSPRTGRLVNPATLQYAPLNHRLREGAELALIVDADKPLGPSVPETGGVSFHRVAGYAKLPYDKEGQYVLPAGLEEAVRQMRLPMTRFYALGDEPFGLEAAIDKAAEFLNRIGVPQTAVPLEFEIQGATRKLPPEVWARGVRHSLSRGYGFRYWEITNEPYVGHENRAFSNADDYLQHFLAVSRAVRQVHPEGRIGLSIQHRSPAWGNYLLQQAAGHYDFVVPHYYCSLNVQRNSFEDVVLGGNYQTLDEALKINALLRAYNAGRDVCQYDTEWGMHSTGPNGERADYVARNGNIYGMMHRAVRLIYYLREGMLRGASSWEVFSYRRAGGFGFLAQDAPRLRSMTYWLYYYFNRHGGKTALAIQGTAPYYQGTAAIRSCRGPLTPAVATLSEDRQRLLLILANGSWDRSIPCRIEIGHFTARAAEAVVLSHPDPDGCPYLERKEDLVGQLPVSLSGSRLALTLPPHAVVFLALQR